MFKSTQGGNEPMLCYNEKELDALMKRGRAIENHRQE